MSRWPPAGKSCAGPLPSLPTNYEPNFEIFHAIEPTPSLCVLSLIPSLPPVGDDLPCPAWVRPSLSGNGNQSRKKEEERPKFALSFFPLSHCRRSEEKMGPPPSSAGPTSAGRRRHRSCSDGPKTWTCRFSPGPFFSSCSFTLYTNTFPCPSMWNSSCPSQ